MLTVRPHRDTGLTSSDWAVIFHPLPSVLLATGTRRGSGFAEATQLT